MRIANHTIVHQRHGVVLLRRPNAKVPLSVHQEIGSILKALIIRCNKRRDLRRLLENVRCTLDDWVQCEYPCRIELPADTFYNLYYMEAWSIFLPMPAAERRDHIVRLKRAIDLLRM